MSFKGGLEVSKYTIYYFQVRGRIQATKYLLIDNDLDFEQINVGSEWATKWKPKMAFGQCPMVVDGDLELFQSNAILRYLGRKHGLNADNIKDEAKIDMFMDHVEDVRMAYVKMIYGNYEDGKGDYINNIPKKFQPFENLLKAWGNDYILSKITFADYNLFDLLDDHLVLAPDCLKEFPILQAYHARIAGRPKLKTYRDTDAFQKTPVNGNGKQ